MFVRKEVFQVVSPRVIRNASATGTRSRHIEAALRKNFFRKGTVMSNDHRNELLLEKNDITRCTIEQKQRLTKEERKPKNIAIFIDGTWNTPETGTNVYNMFQMVQSVGRDGMTPQRCLYIKGVGSEQNVGLVTKLTQSLFGRGAHNRICEAYRWLANCYEDGDKVFLFGFSRGAFIARSLAGFIATCGLLRPQGFSSFSIEEAFEFYQRSSTSGSEQSLRPLYRLPRSTKSPQYELLPDEAKALVNHSRRIDIEFLGLWDTVQKLGIATETLGFVIPFISTSSLWWHNLRLSTILKNGAQALALDERRSDFPVTMWTEYVPRGREAKHPRSTTFEQRWFPGAHANVGGGYPGDALPLGPLKWIAGRAEELGLCMDYRQAPLSAASIQTHPNDADVIDSYDSFARGLYKRVFPAVWRQILPNCGLIERGAWHPVQTSIDTSVFDRWQHDPSYRPQNLTDWAKQMNFNLEGYDLAQGPVWADQGIPVRDVTWQGYQELDWSDFE
eukprot:m.3789 g.3789  ORF g.3789 m.3789 type:complete len:503 (-) comp2825_c0_seq1:27-1535(-)